MILTNFLKLFARETLEPVLKNLLTSLITHATSGFLNNTVSEDYHALLLKGLKDPKASIRVMYLTCLAQLIDLDVSLREYSNLIKFCLNSLEKIQTSGIALLDPKKDTPAFIEGVIAIIILMKLTKANHPETSKSIFIICSFCFIKS